MAYNKLDLDARREARSGRSCEQCGSAISDDKPTGTRFCRPICARRARSARDRLKFASQCVRCGVGFFGCTEAQRYCSKSCGVSAQWDAGLVQRGTYRSLTAARFDAVWR